MKGQTYEKEAFHIRTRSCFARHYDRRFCSVHQKAQVRLILSFLVVPQDTSVAKRRREGCVLFAHSYRKRFDIFRTLRIISV